jgi:hypothetical protein
MNLHWVLPSLLTMMVVGPLSAQELPLDTYRINIITKAGNRYQGLLNDVTDSTVSYLTGKNNDVGSVNLADIDRVVLRRSNQKRLVRNSMLLGSLLFGFLTLNGLERNPTQSSTASAITLFWGTGTGTILGGGAGLLLASILHRRIVRPSPDADSQTMFRRQLEPLSIRYQTQFFNPAQR